MAESQIYRVTLKEGEPQFVPGEWYTRSEPDQTGEHEFHVPPPQPSRFEEHEVVAVHKVLLGYGETEGQTIYEQIWPKE